MTNPNTAISADTSQTPAILDAIYTIAMATDINFKAGKQWAPPEAGETTGNMPFFCVLAPQLVGGSNGHGVVTGEVPRIAGQSRPVHDFLCYALFPHRDPRNPKTFSTPEWAKTILLQTFTVQYTLGGVCLKCDIRDCSVVPKLEFTTHAQPYTAVRLVLRVQERLNVSYS